MVCLLCLCLGIVKVLSCHGVGAVHWNVFHCKGRPGVILGSPKEQHTYLCARLSQYGPLCPVTDGVFCSVLRVGLRNFAIILLEIMIYSAALIVCDESRPGFNWAALRIFILQDCSDASKAGLGSSRVANIN